MPKSAKNPANRYVNDLRRFEYLQGQSRAFLNRFGPVGLSFVFLCGVGLFVVGSNSSFGEDWVMVAAAAVVGGYMALNIGANDVANNMGPAVGGKVLTVAGAIVIAAICECLGAVLAGGDVVNTVAKGIVTPDASIGVDEFRSLMLSALFAAALWINLATYLRAPVSTTHSIVGGVMGAGIAALGFDAVNWPTMSAIAASWVISPVFGGLCAAGMLYLIRAKIYLAQDKRQAAITWMPVLMGLMAAAFTAYMALKGLNKIWRPSAIEIVIYSVVAFGLVFAAARPYTTAKTHDMRNRKKDINHLFDLPLIVGAALLSFAHGANDVANAVGPLAAIVATVGHTDTLTSSIHIPFWVMVVGAFGIALGLGLFGPRLIMVVGQKITRLNSPRAYCVALSAAVTVLVATTLGLPVSSTHIALGAVFGVGFLREFLENPNKRKRRPGHKLNATAFDAFRAKNVRSVRRLVRRHFVVSIAAAWVITVPASALLAAAVYALMQLQ